jgi:hypothetical protein
MYMKIRIQAADLKEAVDTASIVSPKPVTAKGGEGFLFVLKEGGVCRVYSRDSSRHIRVDLPLLESEGEGSFVYPAKKVGSFKTFRGWVEIEAGVKDNSYWVKYRTEGGSSAELVSFDPGLLSTSDESLEEATTEHTYPVAVLKEALSLCRPHLVKPNDAGVTEGNEQLKSIRIFDNQGESAKGDGCFFSAAVNTSFYFHCDALKGKSLAIHGNHLPSVISFLSRCGYGEVTVRTNEETAFAISDKGHVLGWTQPTKQHVKYTYYPRKWETFSLVAPKSLLLDALYHMREEGDTAKDKARLTYSHEDKTLTFKVSSKTGQAVSSPVGVSPVKEEWSVAEAEDFSSNIGISHFLELVEPVKGHEVELRIAIRTIGGRKKGLFRTIESFSLTPQGKTTIPKTEEESFACVVTRFTSSKD